MGAPLGAAYGREQGSKSRGSFVSSGHYTKKIESPFSLQISTFSFQLSGVSNRSLFLFTDSVSAAAEKCVDRGHFTEITENRRGLIVFTKVQN